MLQSMLGSLIVGSLFLVSQQAQAAMVIQVVDSNNFCTFLPPTDSTDRLIADSETEADAFAWAARQKQLVPILFLLDSSNLLTL